MKEFKVLTYLMNAVATLSASSKAFSNSGMNVLNTQHKQTVSR